MNDRKFRNVDRSGSRLLDAVTPDLSACNRQNAADVILVPAGFANPATCLMHGQAYLAASALADNLTAGDRLKVVCVRSGSAAGMAAPTAVR
jgi:hypothetical protein